MTALTPATLLPGDLMFGPIGGFVPGVVPVISVVMVLASRKDRLSWRRWWKVRHVAVVVQAAEIPPISGDIGYRELRGELNGARIVEAMPDGAEEVELEPEKHWTAQHVYLRPAYNPGQPFEIGRENRSGGFLTAHAARGYVGTPYGFLTYGALAAHKLIPYLYAAGAGRMQAAIAKRITDRGEMICSQLADQALTDAGFHVFDDGRLPQDVVPAELYRRLIGMAGTRVLIPGDGGWI